MPDATLSVGKAYIETGCVTEYILGVCVSVSAFAVRVSVALI